MLNQKHLRRRFERAAASFDDADFVHAATRAGLLERLTPLRVDAKTVVDLGAATCTASRALRKRFTTARVVSIDFAHNMLKRGRQKKAWLSGNAFAQARAEQLPFQNGSIDVVFSNMLLPCVNSPRLVFTEVARVLRKGGVFAFATLGPDSLQEIRHAWRQIDADSHVYPFPDMHDLGDDLVDAGLRDPVLDVDRLRISYENPRKLFADLTAVGARNALQPRASGLTGKTRFGTMAAALEASAVGGKFALDLELVFGHCWGAGPRNDPANFRIDATAIPRRRA